MAWLHFLPGKWRKCFNPGWLLISFVCRDLKDSCWFDVTVLLLRKFIEVNINSYNIMIQVLFQGITPIVDLACYFSITVKKTPQTLLSDISEGQKSDTGLTGESRFPRLFCVCGCLPSWAPAALLHLQSQQHCMSLWLSSCGHISFWQQLGEVLPFKNAGD